MCGAAIPSAGVGRPFLGVVAIAPVENAQQVATCFAATAHQGQQDEGGNQDEPFHRAGTLPPIVGSRKLETDLDGTAVTNPSRGARLGQSGERKRQRCHRSSASSLRVESGHGTQSLRITAERRKQAAKVILAREGCPIIRCGNSVRLCPRVAARNLRHSAPV